MFKEFISDNHNTIRQCQNCGYYFVPSNLKETKYTEAQNVVVFDLSWYAPYKTYGDLLITGFIYLMFLWRLFIKLPNIINGIGSSAEPFDKIGEFTETHRNPFHDDY